MNKKTKFLKLLSALLSALIILDSLPLCASAEAPVFRNEGVETNSSLEVVVTASDENVDYDEVGRVVDLSTIYPKIHGILFTDYDCGLDEEMLLSKIETGDTGDVIVQLELKDKFFNSEIYQKIKLSKQDYDNYYDYLRDLRSACNDFYRKQILTIGQGMLFSHNDYYSCFYDISEFVFDSPEPITEIRKFVEMNEIENVIVSEKHETFDMPIEGKNDYSTVKSACNFYGETIESINATRTISKDSRIFTGKGIKIGVSELNMSYVNTRCSSHKNFTLMPELDWGSINCNAHVHHVLSTIASVAPDAQIYGADSSMEGITWLIGENVSVINCSWGKYENSSGQYSSGQYCEEEKKFDTLALDNDVIFVFASGNYQQDYHENYLLFCPQSAYNIVTVGATDQSGDNIASYSCFETKFNVGKPNLVANGSPHALGAENSGHSNSGTSLAAPLVTGAIALMQEGSSGLGVHSAMAMLAASANLKKIKNPAGKNYAGFDSKAGAGVLDVDRLIFNSFETSFSNFGLSSNKIISEIKIRPYAGLPIKICATWCAKPIANGQTQPVITNYDLLLYNSSGKLVASSSSPNNNQELIEYIPPVEETYTIQLYMKSSTITNGYDFGTIVYSYDFDSYYG